MEQWQLRGAESIFTNWNYSPTKIEDSVYGAHNQDGWLHLQTRQITRLGRIKSDFFQRGCANIYQHMTIILGGINGRLSAGHGGVHHECCMGGQLGSAAHPSLLLQHKCPPFSTICKRKASATSINATLPASSLCEGHFIGQKHASTSAECLEIAATRSLLFIPSALSAFHKHILAPSRWIHLQRRIEGRGGCSDWNSTQLGGIKSLLTAEKSRLIHRSLQEDFRWEESSLFRRLFLCACFFFLTMERE